MEWYLEFYIYVEYGIYMVEFKVYIWCCLAIFVEIVMVVLLLFINFGVIFEVGNCFGDVFFFEDFLEGVVDIWFWVFFGGQLVIVDVFNLIVIYNEFGVYFVIFIVIDIFGQIVMFEMEAVVEIQALFIVVFEVMVNELQVVFQNNVVYVMFYLWDFGDGQ